ncbi:MAG: excinuclease ABC subunit UvrA, partial [Verrucomicrobia bacterium]|nr:excinuclease ABC subunit UvrA [Verrucomicrobiota bacterium]
MATQFAVHSSVDPGYSRGDMDAIRLFGVRQNNLKNFDLEIPRNNLVVISGVSGSGKSSLAFDTLFAEGQRRYIETFSPYARQFLDRMDKPMVDRIEGITPAIAVEQRNAIKTTRSTVGTLTEICDFMKVVWPRISRLYCNGCGREVRKDTPATVWKFVSDWTKQQIKGRGAGTHDLLVVFTIPVSKKLGFNKCLDLVVQQGYQRVLINSNIMRIEDLKTVNDSSAPDLLTVIQDRIKPRPNNRARFIEACEQAYHFGKGRLGVYGIDHSKPDTPPRINEVSWFSNRRHCASCDIEYREPTQAMFSYNHPMGACPACKGFGSAITTDLDSVIPNTSLTLEQGAIAPWRSGYSRECQDDLIRYCRRRGVPTDIPFAKLKQGFRDWVINGDPDYGVDASREWPNAWYGVRGYFQWLESRSYKMHVRVFLSRYRKYVVCPDCRGSRFKHETLSYKLVLRPGRNSRRELRGVQRFLGLDDFYRLPIDNALGVIDGLTDSSRFDHNDPVRLALNEVRSRLGYLVESGLGYLTLDRPARTLSGGEVERVNLTTCLGSRLVKTLFVLDEPTVGLHDRDIGRLVRILEALRDAGNTVVVVEHEESVMRAADRIIDLGPGHGDTGGEVVFNGAVDGILMSRTSITGRYLCGAERILIPKRRRVAKASGRRSSSAGDARRLTISGARLHNLKDITVSIPLERFVCVTGVSGSGKSTLVRDLLYSGLKNRLEIPDAAHAERVVDEADEIETAKDGYAQLRGWRELDEVLMVDQSPIGKTPRSNPAIYIGAFTGLRKLFASSDQAKQAGLEPNAFSFNSPVGRCDHCGGAGFEKIEMQFLSDVFTSCPQCNGIRFKPHVLDITVETVDPKKKKKRGWTIVDFLDATIDEAIEFLALMNEKIAAATINRLRVLQDVGLGYIKLGQPLNTLSGGESQRLKLARRLAEFAGGAKRDT